MARIIIKSLKDPLIINDDRVLSLKEDFESGKLSGMIRIGNIATVRAEDIRMIILDENPVISKGENNICSVPKCSGNCYWLIVRKDGRAIWKQTYKTKSEATDEMKFENLFGKYDLEHRFN